MFKACVGVLSLTVFVAFSGGSAADPVSTAMDMEVRTPFATISTGDRCIRLIRQGNSEVLVNSCTVCRTATIIRSRPGSAVPVGRRFNVQARSTFPVPFRGPGRSRIRTDIPCPGNKGGAKDLLKADVSNTKSAPTCVSMERAGNDVVMSNTCGTCRAVAFERISGANRSRDYLLVSGRAKVPVSANGYDSVALLADIACPK